MQVTGTPRLLVVTKTLDVGGGERLIVDSARRWPGAIEVAFLAGIGELRHELEASDLRVHDLSVRGRLRTATLRRLWQLLRSGRFDLVHAHLPVAGVLVRILSRGLPIVYSEHNVWEIYHPVTRLLNRLTYARNSAVIAVSQEVASSIQRNRAGPAPPVRVIQNGIAGLESAVSRNEARAREGAGPNDVVVLNVGNLFRRKGQDLLLEAMSRVSSPHVRVWIVGEGEEHEALTRAITRLSLNDRVKLLGRRRDVRELMEASDVFAMPSRFEGLPVALLEAMDAGLPAIVSTVGGMPEVIGEDGLHVPPEDPAALAAAITRLSSDRALRERLGAQGRVRVRTRFSAAAMDDATLAVYRSVLEPR